jgi:hypothetical protein
LLKAAEQRDDAPARVKVGSVLNHIYEVKTFLARGGMGEVFEGVNLTSHERVAIKVILPHLAADAAVREMFLKEARVLTRLAHPAIRQYRLITQEPELGVLYMVNEFIDGPSLISAMATLKPTAAEVTQLLRRLAGGLQAAHEMGAVHRDIAPDNVLLPEGRLDRAKIIDFGIVKDLDPGKQTIIGDGFAGKLGYVAPEQFGDFNREIGPWTDVYSLGLVVLATALHRELNMGATVVEAVDRRRAGPDLSDAPPSLRPVLERMLKANPAERLRSMQAVLEALDSKALEVEEARTVWRPQAPPQVTLAAPAPLSEPPDNVPAAPLGRASPLMVAGGAAGLLAVAAIVAALVLWPRNAPAPGPAAEPPAVRPVTASLPESTPIAARGAVEAALANIACSWLNIGDLNGAQLQLEGAVGDKAAASQAVAQAAQRANTTLSVDVDHAVAPVSGPICGALDAFRAIRDSDSSHLKTDQKIYQIKHQAGGYRARPTVTINIAGTDEFGLFGVDTDGRITKIIGSRAELKADLAEPGYRGTLSSLGADQYQFQIDSSSKGWAGILLIVGDAPVDATLVSGDRGTGWAQIFAGAAKAGNWKARMVWYDTVAS